MGKQFIRIGGARERNLKNLTLEIPRDKLVVITGLSGNSYATSLANIEKGLERMHRFVRQLK